MRTQDTTMARGTARGMSHLDSETRDAVSAALWFGIEESKQLEDKPVFARISWGVNILRDMHAKLNRYGFLSSKQIDFALKLHSEAKQRVAEFEKRVAERSALAESGVRVPEGRVEIEGVIVSTKEVSTAYGDTVKCIILLPTGAKVWGTLPGRATGEQGSRVRFVATVKPSDDDPTFGFYKRPFNWQTLAAN